MIISIRFLLMGLAGVGILGLAACGDDPGPESNVTVPATHAEVASFPAANAGTPTADTSNNATPGTRGGELNDPSGYDMYWVYVDWTGNHPDYGEAAERNVGRSGNTFDGQTVNEFNRAGLVAQERARLESLGKSARNIGFVTTNIGGRLGDYDPGYGEFYIGPMTPGSFISFSPTNWPVLREAYKGIDIRHVKLRLTNALDGYIWKTSADEASRIIALLEQEGNVGRQIYARARLQLLEVAVTGEMPEMSAQVLSYTLHSESGTQLAEFDLSK